MTDAIYPAVVVKISDEDGGGFLAFAPDLPGCMSDGQTDVEALGNLRLAINEWVDEALRLNREIPQPGSAGKAAQERRNKLLQIVKAQDEMIKRQQTIIKQELQELNGEILEIKTRLADLSPGWAEMELIPQTILMYGTQRLLHS
jgi:predicted RNase H-like HicB family nuclease